MSRWHSYLNTAKTILQQYNGEEPFASFLKKFFSLQKKYGSRDRKTIGHLCYCFFRLGKAAVKLPVEEGILAGVFLCSDQPDEILESLKPEWNRQIELPVAQKLAIVDHSLLLTDVFPWKNEMSEGMNHEKFCESFFVQPDVFLRLRPGGYGAFVRGKLSDAGILFREIGENCLALPSASKIDGVLALDHEAMIQDLNSQQTSEAFRQAIADAPLPFISVWDCCAGSGGKSLMLYDLYDQLDLVVSDRRESIISNLKKRFAAHGIHNYQAVVADVAKPVPKIGGQSKFNIIICDAPCTGSGTWSRTPEQLYYFDQTRIDEYAMLQKNILTNVIPHIAHGGYLLYITCSVFKKENEDAVAFIKEEFSLQLEKMPARMTRSDGELLKGYDKKADTMFVALLKKPL